MYACLLAFVTVPSIDFLPLASPFPLGGKCVPTALDQPRGCSAVGQGECVKTTGSKGSHKNTSERERREGRGKGEILEGPNLGIQYHF